MDRKFQHAVRLKPYLGNSKRADTLLNINHHVVAVEED
jgi:hypothetical protein